MAYKLKSIKQRTGFVNTYYDVLIHKQAKPVGTKQGYMNYDVTEKTFKTEEDFEKYLNENYPTGTIKKTYQDTVSGETYESGFIIAYNSEEYDSDKGKYVKYHHQDWFAVNKVESRDTEVKITKTKLKQEN